MSVGNGINVFVQGSSFVEASQFAGFGTLAVVAADIDGDGDQDIASCHSIDDVQSDLSVFWGGR